MAPVGRFNQVSGFAAMTMALVAGVVVAAGPVEPTKGPGTLKVVDGLEATLFAAEPLLSSPSDIDVDAKGRVWVCEVMNYRGRANTRQEGDRILVLEDSDGDGTADKQTVFHQGRDVDSALGICVIGEGPGRKVIVSCSPNVFVFHDDDGDLKADRKETLFTKCGWAQHDHSTHAFVTGPDGRLYFNFGNTGEAVADKEGKTLTDRFGNGVWVHGKPYRQGMVFRCKPDGTDFEVLGWNFRNNYEVAVDSFGDLWQSDNDDDGNKGVRINWVMEFGNYGYTDEKTGAGWQAPRTNQEVDIPRRHWHQNDPGVVPNLIQTGAGSPTGICVYEGTLLPEKYRGALLHCDAGPNVVRAYHVAAKAAGYAAEMETVVDGSADQWFRPSDVCVAPDGSVIVADWYDPGVGGHGMGDTEKGRIYRIAPAGSKWTVPPVDFSTVAGAVKALESPSLCTRATAIERLAQEPEAAAAAVAAAFATATDPRLKARLAWAAGMLPGQAEGWMSRLVADADPRLRIVGLRLCRRVQGDVLSLAEKLAADPEAAVRREVAIALRGEKGDRADRAWAELAARHAAGDRWELEALGIGADGPAAVSQWDGRLAAWLVKIDGNVGTPAAREIIWRSRGSDSPRMICDVIGATTTTTPESLAFVRALDFQDPATARQAIAPLVKTLSGPEEKITTILPELIMRLDAAAMADADVARRVEAMAESTKGTERFIDIAQRFALKHRSPELIAMASKEDALAVRAIGLALDLGGTEQVRQTVAAGGDAAAKMLMLLGMGGQPKAMEIVDATYRSSAPGTDLRTMAIRAKARSHHGAKQLVAWAKAGELDPSSIQVAAHAISACPWGDIRQQAADVLPMPKAKGGEKLPSVNELVQRHGDPARGREVFTGVGTCAKCHVVNGEGRQVGPDLSGVGAKLSREALYEAILVPSAAISHSYETHTAILADGRSVTGLLISKSPDQAVIRNAEGIDMKLDTKEIEELVKLPVSLMPADLAATLTSDSLVDLVAWLETLKAVK